MFVNEEQLAVLVKIEDLMERFRADSPIDDEKLTNRMILWLQLAYQKLERELLINNA